MDYLRFRELERENLALRQTRDALRESEERFRGAFDHAAIGMALVATDGQWLQVNRALCAITGYSESELLGLTFQDITYPDDLDADLGQVRQMLAGTIQHYDMEKRYFHKNGHIVWILLSVSLVHDAEGKPLYFVAQIQDITQRKASEEACRNSEEKLRRVLDTAVNAFVATDARGRITDWNRQAERTFGWPRAEALGRLLAETILPARARSAYQAAVDHFLATGEGAMLCQRAEMTALHRDGHEFPVEITVSPLPWRGSYLFNAFVHDISARKDAEAEREALIRQLQEALATVKTLRGLLPICAWCKQVRNDAGYWRHLEAHLQEHLDVQLTHGICPTCLHAVLPEAAATATPVPAFPPEVA